jgi:hypothetical protein
LKNLVMPLSESSDFGWSPRHHCSMSHHRWPITINWRPPQPHVTVTSRCSLSSIRRSVNMASQDLAHALLFGPLSSPPSPLPPTSSAGQSSLVPDGRQLSDPPISPSQQLEVPYFASS